MHAFLKISLFLIALRRMLKGGSFYSVEIVKCRPFLIALKSRYFYCVKILNIIATSFSSNLGSPPPLKFVEFCYALGSVFLHNRYRIRSLTRPPSDKISRFSIIARKSVLGGGSMM